MIRPVHLWASGPYHQTPAALGLSSPCQAAVSTSVSVQRFSEKQASTSVGVRSTSPNTCTIRLVKLFEVAGEHHCEGKAFLCKAGQPSHLRVSYFCIANYLQQQACQMLFKSIRWVNSLSGSRSAILWFSSPHHQTLASSGLPHTVQTAGQHICE